MVKLKRKQYDEIIAVLIKKAKEIEPRIDLQRLFSRAYSNIYKLNKLEHSHENEQGNSLKPINKN